MTAGVWQKDQRYTLAVDVAASTDERTVLSIWKLTDGAPRIIATISDPAQRAAEQVAGLLPGLLMGHSGDCPCASVRRTDPYPTCTCGADMHNARLDELRRSLGIADQPPVPKIRIVTRDDCPPDVIAMSGDGGKTWVRMRSGKACKACKGSGRVPCPHEAMCAYVPCPEGYRESGCHGPCPECKGTGGE